MEGNYLPKPQEMDQTKPPSDLRFSLMHFACISFQIWRQSFCYESISGYQYNLLVSMGRSLVERLVWPPRMFP